MTLQEFLDNLEENPYAKRNANNIQMKVGVYNSSTGKFESHDCRILLAFGGGLEESFTFIPKGV